jgi:hypothetical protein
VSVVNSWLPRCVARTWPAPSTPIAVTLDGGVYLAPADVHHLPRHLIESLESHSAAREQESVHCCGLGLVDLVDPLAGIELATYSGVSACLRGTHRSELRTSGSSTRVNVIPGPPGCFPGRRFPRSPANGPRPSQRAIRRQAARTWRSPCRPGAQVSLPARILAICSYCARPPCPRGNRGAKGTIG